MYAYRSKTGGAGTRTSQTRGTGRERPRFERLTEQFAMKRQVLTQVASTIRTLTVERNYLIAQALKDGVQETRVANASGESVRGIRKIARAYDDLERSFGGVESHVANIRSCCEELSATMRVKDTLENERELFIQRARTLTGCDSFDLAIATGLTPQEVRNVIRRRCRKKHDGKVAEPATLSAATR